VPTTKKKAKNKPRVASERRRARPKKDSVASLRSPTPVDTGRLKLTIELVPATSWGRSLKRLLPQSDWDRIRRQAYAQYGHRCGIGATQGRLNSHELWDYDDVNHVQKLVGFIALCDLCHFVKHLGFAGILATEGKLNFENVLQHFLKVNECDLETLNMHRKQAAKQWRERSMHKWVVDFGIYANLINQEEGEEK
jgi:hypothetical protein